MSERRVASNVPIVFISSTAEDLRPYRAAARDAAVEAEFLPRMMEYFIASGDKPPLPACLEKVAGANVVVAIVAHRYGWIPPDQPSGQHKSITWLECEKAVADGQEVLAFLVDEKAPWPQEDREEYQLTQAVREERATPAPLSAIQQNLGDLKAWLTGRGLRVTFTTPEDLRGKVGMALQGWRDRHPQFAPRPAAVRWAPEDPGKYLRSLLGRTAFIDIRGLQVGTGKRRIIARGHPTTAHRFPIEDLFISLTTTMATSEPAEGPHAGASEVRGHTPVPLHAALANPRLVVIGDPGSGKTTFLRRVANTLCRAALSDDAEAAQRLLSIADRPFPILVDLADLVEHIAVSRQQNAPSAPTLTDSPAWLAHFLARRSQEEEWGLDEDFFRRRIREGPCLLMLDGLDEAPGRQERESIARLIESVSTTYPACRIVVTSRPSAYTGEAVLLAFAQGQIDPLDQDAVRTFLDRWCKSLWGDAAEAGSHRETLVAALRSRPEIARMARNPVMLTALAMVHWNERRLPEQRADLYESVINWLSRSREQRPGRQTAERCVILLQELALAMQDHPEGRQVQVPKHWAAEAIASEFGDGGPRELVDRATLFLDDEEADSGIVVGRGNEIRFWHLTFQEFLAAKAIAVRPEAEQQQLLWGTVRRLSNPEWREVALLLCGVLHQQGRQKVDGFISAALDALGESPSLADQARCAGLLGAVLRELAPFCYQVRDPRYPSLLQDVLGIFDPLRSQSIPVEVRIEAADALGQAGDPRIDPCNPDRVPIRPGKFRMGAQKGNSRDPNYDPEAEDVEWPVHEVHLDAYRIGRYPVTVGEYRRFVEDGGYQERSWWGAGGFGKWAAPGDWEDQMRFPNRPVVRVSWFEAAAYCAWAGCRLPTEAKWERAARGTDARPFPWGSEPPPDPSRLNYSEGRVRHATPVGVYPLGATPDGIQDMAGNVWEWCRDWYAEDYYMKSPASNPTGPLQGEYRVVRGGSWSGGAGNARSALRGWLSPLYHRGSINGFRAVLDVAPRTP